MTRSADLPPLERPEFSRDPIRVPRPLDRRPGFVMVDVAWGTIQPLSLHPEIETVGELELIEHLQAGLPVIDTRRKESYAAETIPGARPLPYTEITRCSGDLDPRNPAILFCNGPQCAATPQAVKALLQVDYPPRSLRYYRGGMHDWVTLELPTTPGRASPPRRPPQDTSTIPALAPH